MGMDTILDRQQRRRNQRAEREEYSALTIAELTRRIHDSPDRLEQSALTPQGSAAKRALIARWESGAPMSRLDLQRVLRIVDELARRN